MTTYTREKIEEVVTVAMEHYSRAACFIPGTFEKAVERALMQSNKDALIDVISGALNDGKIVWNGDDPHDQMVVH